MVFFVFCFLNHFRLEEQKSMRLYSHPPLASMILPVKTGQTLRLNAD